MRAAIICITLAALSAFAQDAETTGSEGGGRATSVLSGKTIKSGMVIHAEFGWPAISATLLNAASDKLDLGGKFNLMYGYEGITALGAVPGMKLQGVARLQLLERGKLNLGVRFEPGVFMYFFGGGGAEVGIALPFKLAMGIAVSPKLMANIGLDIPMFVVFGPYGGLAVPLLVGGGVEYALDSSLGLTFNTRIGPSVPIAGNRIFVGRYDIAYCQDNNGRFYRCGGYYTYNVPAVELMIGVSYRL